MNWTLSQLRAFCAVGDLGTMTAAAEQLGYTTGAISQQITALEKVTGQELFIRIGRELVLTDSGVALLSQARFILEAEARAKESITLESDLTAVCKVGIFGSAALFAIPRVLDLLTGMGLALRVRVFECPLEAMPGAVLDGTLDVALSVTYPDAPTPPVHGLEISDLHTEEFRLVLPPGVESDIESAHSLKEYCNDSDWILPPAEEVFGKASLFALARSGIQPRVRHSVRDTALSLALAESGVGITTATPLMLALRPTNVLLRDFPDSASRTIVALTKPLAEHRESIRMVVRSLQEVFARHA